MPEELALVDLLSIGKWPAAIGKWLLWLMPEELALIDLLSSRLWPPQLFSP